MVNQHPPSTSGERFVALWLRCAPRANATQAKAIHAHLCGAYAEAGRHYHTLTHIEHCLREFDRARATMAVPDDVELALWYHDAVYQSGNAENEKRSAELFVRDAHGQLTNAQCERVCALIMATMHLAPPSAGQSAWVVDIDLSSFALPWPEFLRDSHAVRAEMKDLDDERYFVAHDGFLRGLLARPRIYTTDYFYAHHEQSARTNISRLLDAYAVGIRL